MKNTYYSHATTVRFRGRVKAGPMKSELKPRLRNFQMLYYFTHKLQRQMWAHREQTLSWNNAITSPESGKDVCEGSTVTGYVGAMIECCLEPVLSVDLPGWSYSTIGADCCWVYAGTKRYSLCTVHSCCCSRLSPPPKQQQLQPLVMTLQGAASDRQSFNR